MNDKIGEFELPGASKLIAAAATFVASISLALADVAQYAAALPSSQDDEQTILPLVFRVFARDMFSAGLDEPFEKQMRMFLGSASMSESEQDRLLIHFQSTWLDVEEEIDQSKREMLCERAIDSAESTQPMSRVAGSSNALEVIIYTKHFVMHEAELLITEQIDLRAVLLNYPISKSQLLETRNRKINQSFPDAAAEVKRFCATPWEYEFIFSQPDGTNKRHRIEL